MDSINEHIISFRGKATLDRPLELEHDYEVKSTVTCTKISQTKANDGSTDLTYTVEPVVSEVTFDGGEKKKLKKKGKRSVAMMWGIKQWAMKALPEIEDEERAYDMCMGWMLDDLDQLLDWLKKKNYHGGILP